MNENQEPNNEWKTVEGPGPENPKKKGMGPVKGILLALLIVFLLCVIGLLIRMVVSGDGDYFAPIKNIFGISEEKDDDSKEKESKKQDKVSGKTTSKKLSMVSSDAKKSGVKHYSMTISLKEAVKVSKDLEDEVDDFKDMIDLSKTRNNQLSKVSVKKLSDFEDYNDSKIEPRTTFEDDNEYNYNDDYNYDNQIEPYSNDYNYDDQIEPYNDNYPSGDDELDVDNYFNLLEQYEEFIDGELYIDLFAKKNEIVQLVIGLDYMPIVEKYYDYGIENEISQIESFETAEDFAEYIGSTLKMALTKETLIESLGDELQEYGISERDLEDLIDINIDTGLFEFYLKLNDDLNEKLAEYIEEYSDEIEELGIDPENIFETAVPVYNKEMKNEGYYDLFKITVE